VSASKPHSILREISYLMDSCLDPKQVGIVRMEAESLLEQLETYENALRLLASEETWAAAHPHGTFGLPPNTWGPAPSWVRTLARTALNSNPASRQDG